LHNAALGLMAQTANRLGDRQFGRVE